MSKLRQLSSPEAPEPRWSPTLYWPATHTKSGLEGTGRFLEGFRRFFRGRFVTFFNIENEQKGGYVLLVSAGWFRFSLHPFGTSKYETNEYDSKKKGYNCLVPLHFVSALSRDYLIYFLNCNVSKIELYMHKRNLFNLQNYATATALHFSKSFLSNLSSE